MSYTFDNKYLLKTFASIVNGEGKRIVLLGLATDDAVRGFVEPSLRTTIESTDDISIIISALAEIGNDLKSVCLPGDFEKITAGKKKAFYDIIGISQNNDDDDDEEEDEEKPKKKEKSKDKEDKKEEEEDDVEDIEIIYSFVSPIVNLLQKMAYNLGNQGNHKAAYAIERKIDKIEALAKKRLIY